MRDSGTFHEMAGSTGEPYVAAALRQLGAHHAWLVRAGRDELLGAAVGDGHAAVIKALDGIPRTVADVRARAGHADRALVVDVTETTPFGCPAVRLGADLAFAQMGDGSIVVAAGRDVGRRLPGVEGRLGGLPACDGIDADLRVEEARRRWHVTCDAAAVVARYLACHPSVAEVRYPGLRDDPSHEVAARTLSGGFGAVVCYAPAGSPHVWETVTATTDDPREQVMALERRLGPAASPRRMR